jgi:hypothetical protein
MEVSVTDERAPVVTGWFFVAAAVMTWLGWVLLPVKIGAFFEPGDFAAIHQRLYLWIWLYRVHIFGLVIGVMAVAALAAATAGSAARVWVWPGAAVAATGLAVGAVGTAFYYHFGAWGATDLDGRPAVEAAALVDTLRVPTEYVTCLVRFSRVFLGLGLTVLAVGLWIGAPRARPLAVSAVALGVAAMAITMAFPDALELYAPVFHLDALWLLGLGAALVTRKVRLPTGAT